MFGAQHLSILAAVCIWAAAQRRFPSGAAVYVLATTCRLPRMLRAVPTRRCSANAPPPGHAGFSKACGAGGAGAVAPARSQLSTIIHVTPPTAARTRNWRTTLQTSRRWPKFLKASPWPAAWTGQINSEAGGVEGIRRLKSNPKHSTGVRQTCCGWISRQGTCG